jgi:2-C-methyl-D-erythritol 4-phosphate cytidylyltransferase
VLRYWLVMPAAGTGRRFGDVVPKQYAQIHDRTVIEWALQPFLGDARCAACVVALAADDSHFPKLARSTLERVERVAGGAQRSESVERGLRALAGRAHPADWVLVHDAARPCMPSADLERLLDACGAHPSGGLLAAPLADTLKRAHPQPAPGATGLDVIEATLERAGLWRALTPQMFRYGALCEALAAAHRAGRVPTDEAQALEWQGVQPLLVPGSAANLKITTAEDLILARALLAREPGRGGEEQR